MKQTNAQKHTNLPRLIHEETENLNRPITSKQIESIIKSPNKGKSYDYTVEVKNRFKGVYLEDRVPEELWMEVCNIVQGMVLVTKTIPKKKKCKRAKWLSEEALQIAEERRDMKGKVERKRDT